MMNSDLNIVMYEDTNFKHTLIKSRITVCVIHITACLKSVSRVFKICVCYLEHITDSIQLSKQFEANWLDSKQLSIASS